MISKIKYPFLLGLQPVVSERKEDIKNLALSKYSSSDGVIGPTIDFESVSRWYCRQSKRVYDLSMRLGSYGIE